VRRRCTKNGEGLARRFKLDKVGWHTFHHTYRPWLDDSGAPIGVQQKLMRHSDISTTAKVWRCADGIQAQAQLNRGSQGFGE